jgi:hypothetical protein
VAAPRKETSVSDATATNIVTNNVNIANRSPSGSEDSRVPNEGEPGFPEAAFMMMDARATRRARTSKYPGRFPRLPDSPRNGSPRAGNESATTAIRM